MRCFKVIQRQRQTKWKSLFFYDKIDKWFIDHNYSRCCTKLLLRINLSIFVNHLSPFNFFTTCPCKHNYYSSNLRENLFIRDILQKKIIPSSNSYRWSRNLNIANFLLITSNLFINACCSFFYVEFPQFKFVVTLAMHFVNICYVDVLSLSRKIWLMWLSCWHSMKNAWLSASLW